MASGDLPSDASDPPPGQSPEARVDALGQAWLERLRAGEFVSPEMVAEEHPDLAQEILDTFPILALMEGLKPPPPMPAPTDLAASPIPGAVTSTLPTAIDGYRVLRELGRGGMGRVYEVRTPSDERAALKLVHPHLLDRPGILARFLREFDIGLRVTHPGVVTTLASGITEVDGRELPYLVLEFVEGETLRDVLMDTGRVSERLAREIGLALAEALEAIHAAGVVHRDIKPENVVIAPDERITLMDLGVALVEEEALRLTQTGEFVGSLLYAAPEQLRSRDVDGRTDLYALGLLLFELVAGRHPEAAGGGSMLSRRFGHARAPRLRSVVPQTTAFFERLVQTLLAADPKDRFDDAKALTAVLRDGEDGAWWQAQQARVDRNERPRRFTGAAPLTGREPILATLDAALAATAEDGQQVVVMRGEAGQGKSHLASAWLDRAEAAAPAISILYVEYAPGAGAMELTPIATALKPHLRDVDMPTLETWLGPHREHAPALRAALGLSDAPWPTEARDLVPDRSALELYAVLVMRALSQTAPVVILFEDLHFAPREGQELFARLASVFRDDAVLLLGTTRPSEPPIPEPALARLDHVSVIDLPGLDPHDALRLLATVLGTDPTQPEVINRLVKKSDGNPYCLLEFARALQDASIADRLMAEDVALPGGVRALVEERLAVLDAADRELLELAACDGYRFDPTLVCEAAGLPRLAGLRTLNRLERDRGLITAEGSDYRFHHHLVQEVLHDSLPPALRAACHSALAETLEAAGADANETSPARSYALARHYLLGETPPRALPHLEAGLAHLMALSEVRRAGTMAERALKHIPDLQPGLRARLRLHHQQASVDSIAPELAVQMAERAVEDAREAEDLALQVEALDHLSGAVAQAGRHEDAAPIVAEALALAERSGDRLLHARMLAVHAMVSFDLGQPERAVAEAEQALAMARAEGDAGLTGRAGLYLASLLLEIEGVESALPRAEFALATGELHGNGTLILNALSVLGRIANTRGRAVEANELLLRGKALARDLGRTRRMWLASAGLATAALNRGDEDEAIAIAREGLEVSERMGWREYHVLLSVPYLHALAATGHVAGARAAVETATTMLEHVPLPAITTRLMPVAAQHYTWCGRFDEAEACIARCRTSLERVHAPREMVLIEQAAAGLLDARGDPAGALAAYTALEARARTAQLPLLVQLIALRRAGLLVTLGQDDAAIPLLERVQSTAERDGLRRIGGEAAAWHGVANGRWPVVREVFADDGRRPAPFAGLRLATVLARRSEEDADRQRVRALVRARIESALPDERTQVEQIALVRDAHALP